MKPQPTYSPLAQQLLDLAREEQFAKIDEIWLGRIGELPNQSAFYREFARTMRKAKAEAQAEGLLAFVLEDRMDSGKFRVALRILAATITAFPQSSHLRGALARAIRGYWADLEEREAILKLIDLEGAAPLPEAFQAFQEWVKLTPGQVHQHYDWGEGVIQELNLDTGKVLLSFPKDPAKMMTVDGVKKYLKYIEPGSFLARRAKDPEGLLRQAESEPAELVKAVLADQEGRRIKQGDLKTLITPGVVPADQWNGWWGKAREALKLDPYIDFDPAGGAHAMIQLREQPRTFEQEIEEQFFAADASTELKAEMIRQLARRPKDAALPLALARRMADRLRADWAQSAAAGPGTRLEIAFMLEDLQAALPEAGIEPPDTQPILAAITDYQILFELDNVDYGVRAFTRLLERDGEAGCRTAAALIPRAPVKLAQAIWGALDQEHHLEMAVAALQRLLDEPLENPETYAWAVRATLDGSWRHVEDYFPASALVTEVLDNMETWQKLATDGADTAEHQAAAKTLISRMRTLLAAGKFDALSRAVEDMSRESVTRLRHKIQVHSALPSTFKSQAERIIALTRRDLEEPAAAKAREEEVHYCTARAYAEKAQELRLIASVKIPQNSRVIEEARMEGDLRENAGYQYAKEEQKMLLQQQATLSDLLGRASVVHAGDVDPSQIGFGTALRVKNLKTGEDEQYTILGRWEANPERRILSQQAPLAQQFTGRRVGDEVTIEHPGGGSTDYEVLEITNAIASGDWDNASAAEASPSA